MNDIVHIASELAPVAKVGGLGDVIHGLCRALVKKGHQVRVFLPKYDCLDYSLLSDLQIIEKTLVVEENKIAISNTLWSAKFDGLDLILVEPHHPKAYFERKRIYGETDDNDRFLYFCKVVSTVLKKAPPKVVHLHDWPSAGCALFLKNHSKIVFTIHNLEHQGRCSHHNLERFDIDINDETLRDSENMDSLNLLRGAIAKSHIITTVSPSYREEILSSEYGCGLEKDLQRYKKKLHGILNGIDIDYWNPGSDHFLMQNYTKETFIEAKQKNKDMVCDQLSLPKKKDKPLVTAITRLAAQKGPDLIYYGIEKTLELGGQFALLGSTDDPDLASEFQMLRTHSDVAICLDYDEPLSHRLYAASDMLLMPSIFEPCGLSQMIAMRYGSIPLVRKTGGLKDSVQDGFNGFTFDVPDNKGVSYVLDKAFAAYQSDTWPTLIQNAMETDFSWDLSADKYIAIYEK